MEICSPKMWKSSSTRRTETLSRGGCCCRREFLVPSSDERVTSRSETWASWSHTAWRCSGDRRRLCCRFEPSFTSLVSACFGVRRSEPFAVAFAVHSTSHGREAIAPLRFRSSGRAQAASHRIAHWKSCRTRHDRSITMERSGLSDSAWNFFQIKNSRRVRAR